MRGLWEGWKEETEGGDNTIYSNVKKKKEIGLK